MRTVRIGEGSGFAGAWIEPAVELMEKGDLDYFSFEVLAERTLALAQMARARDPDAGFDPFLEERFRAVLPAAVRRGIRIVTNGGSANPKGAAASVLRTARGLGISKLRVATVEGDDVRDLLAAGKYRTLEGDQALSELKDRIVSANAYLGADPIVEALDAGADVVVTGRVTDSALALACLRHAFGWGPEDWGLLAAGVMVGHLLECSTQITGGYFSDPGYKDVSDLARIGYPIAEVAEDGTCLITKVVGSGGAVTEQTCKEQILYEVHDPHAYLTPDVSADFSCVTCFQRAADEVVVSGATGRTKPDHLKVSVGLRGGYIGEGQISYAGPNAVPRARLAADIVRERLRMIDFSSEAIRFDLIGVDSVYGDSYADRHRAPAPPEVRLRVAARTQSLQDAERIGREVEGLWVAGPAGGGGVSRQTREVISIVSTLIEREAVRPRITVTEEAL